MAIWKENHDGKIPDNKESGDLFKESVLQLARKDEENFAEAYQKAHLVYQKYEVSPRFFSFLHGFTLRLDPPGRSSCS